VKQNVDKFNSIHEKRAIESEVGREEENRHTHFQAELVSQNCGGDANQERSHYSVPKSGRHQPSLAPSTYWEGYDQREPEVYGTVL